MVPQRIEREIVIDAPIEVVWSAVTEPEHISGWFSDSADVDLRPGGRAVLHWNDFGTVQGRVERVEPPHFFSFRWAVDPGRDMHEGNSTLVEFSPKTRSSGISTATAVAGSLSWASCASTSVDGPARRVTDESRRGRGRRAVVGGRRSHTHAGA